MANNVVINVNAQTQNAVNGLNGVSIAIRDAQGRMRNAQVQFVSASSAMTGSLGTLTGSAGDAAVSLGSKGGGLSGALGGVGAIVAASALPAIGALSPMLFGLAAVGGAAALAMDDMKEEAKKLKPEFEALQKVASKAVMPGVKDAIRDVKIALKEVAPVVKVGGQAFGDFVREAGKFAKSPAFQDALLKNVRMGSGWFKEFGSSILTFTQSFMDFGAKSKPTLDALGGGLNSIFKTGLPSMFKGLEKGVAGSAKMFEGLFVAVNKTFDALGRISGSLANTFGGALGVIFRRVGEVVDAIALLLTPAIDALKPVFESITGVMGVSDGMVRGLAEAIGKVLGGAAKVVAVPLKNIFDFFGIVLPMVKDLAAAIAGPLFSAFLTVSGADKKLDGVSASLTDWSNWVKDHREEITDFFRKVNQAILAMVLAAVENLPAIYRAFESVVRASLAVMDVMVQGASKALGWIPGIGDAINDAATNFHAFRGTVDKSMASAGDEIDDFSRAATPKLRENYLRMDIDNWEDQIDDAKRDLGTVPKSKRAELFAKINELKRRVNEAKREIFSVKDRTVTIRLVTQHVTERHAGPGGETKFAHGGIVGRAATGGIRSNRVLVGEQGPEIVDLAPGSRVNSNPDTRRMLSENPGRFGNGPLTINLSIADRYLGQVLIDPLSREIRARGGNVQAVLGQKGK